MDVDPLLRAPDSITLAILGHYIRIRCSARTARDCVWDNFAAMVASKVGAKPKLSIDYSIHLDDGSFIVERDDRPIARAVNLADLIHFLEKDLIVDLQKRRADLFFLHAAAIEWRGKVILLAADAGSGKSTTTWGLMHHGAGYLSDELSPIDLQTLQVHAYPHALCLKKAPPEPYPLPSAAIHLGRTIHVPVPALPGPLAKQPLPLGAVFLIKYDPQLSQPQLRPLRAAEAGARLYLTALNALSHPDRGLTAAVRVAEQLPCYALASAGLRETCAAIQASA